MSDSNLNPNSKERAIKDNYTTFEWRTENIRIGTGQVEKLDYGLVIRYCYGLLLVISEIRVCGRMSLYLS